MMQETPPPRVKQVTTPQQQPLRVKITEAGTKAVHRIPLQQIQANVKRYWNYHKQRYISKQTTTKVTITYQ